MPVQRIQPIKRQKIKQIDGKDPKASKKPNLKINTGAPKQKKGMKPMSGM